jgi:hypothetical protein
LKVYVMEADLNGNSQDATQKRDDLGRAIARLASAMNEPVWFHDFKTPVAGAPVVMVECSDTFLAEVKKLSGFKNAVEISSGGETERKPNIQQFFSHAPAVLKKPTPPRP